MSTHSATLIARHYTVLSGVQVHYRYLENPGKPLLLLLHQTPSSSAMYEAIMPLLAEHFSVLAPDTPGFGESDALGKFDVHGIAQQFVSLAQQLSAQPFFVFGHHTGAAIAVEIMANFGTAIRAGCLSGPPLLSEAMKKKLLDNVPAIPSDDVQLLHLWQLLRAKDSGASVDLSRRELQSALKAGRHYYDSYLAVTRYPLVDRLLDILCPVLVFAGNKDPLYDAVELTADHIVQSQVVYFSVDAGTYICELLPDLVAKHLIDFFALHTGDL